MASSPCIALVGKGGVGKTTLAAFTLRHLLQHNLSPILAVDADPSVCLAGVLGLTVEETIGGIREDTRSEAKGIPETIPKQQYLELKIQEAVTEASGFDLLTMGRPEGPGCYCFVNNILRDNLDRLSRGYQAVVIDCEAGLEHISRRTSRDVDIMIFVADPTVKALETIKAALTTADELSNTIARKLLIINRIPSGMEAEVWEAVANRLDVTLFEAIGKIPQDGAIFEAELQGKNLLELEASTPSYRAFSEFITSLKPSLWERAPV
jgi:CO dehydrogenase maturation factor